MTKTFFILIILFILNAGFADLHYGSYSGKWVVEKSSCLNIQGETNVNSFRCDVTEYLRSDTLFYDRNDAAKKLNFVNSHLRIDVRRFDCHNKLITKDFMGALKTDDNPELVITFRCLDQFSSPSQNQQVKGTVDVSLAGVAKRIELGYVVKMLDAGRIELNGSHVFTFSDFNLKAPKKLAGLIRTKNEIKVNFHLFFRAIS